MLTVLSLNKIFLVSILCVFIFIAYIRTIYNKFNGYDEILKVIIFRPTHTCKTRSDKGKQKYF